MRDQQISAHLTAALALWGTSFTIATVDLFVSPDIDAFALLAAAAAATLQTRGWICKVMLEERNAFELGRDSAQVRSLRR